MSHAVVIADGIIAGTVYVFGMRAQIRMRRACRCEFCSSADK